MQFDINGLERSSASAAEFLATLQSRARLIESLGYGSVWGYDHLFHLVDTHLDAPERFTTLTAAACATTTLGLGTLVIGNTYRHPAVLAKLAATLDIISNGRFTLGIGAGWTEPEHVAYGIPFPPFKERIARLRETLQILTGLWTHDEFTFDGEYYQLKDAPFAPRSPQRPHTPIMVGGNSDGMLRLAATFGQEWNAGMGSPGYIGEKVDRIRQFCDEVGRDFATLRLSTIVNIRFIDNPAEAETARAEYVAHQKHLGAIGRAQKIKWVGVNETVDEALLGSMLIGSSDFIAEGMERFAAMGIGRIIMGVQDEAILRRFSAEVLSAFAGRDRGEAWASTTPALAARQSA